MKKLNDKELMQKLEQAVVEEKKLTIVVLELLQEVENRKLYGELGYHSLFAYCTQKLGYSEAEASVRVNATRLVNNLPEVKKKLDDGSIGLTQASKVQTLFRQEKIVDEEKKREVVEKVSGKSTRETDEILRQLSTTKKNEKKITIHERLLKKIEQLQEEEDYSGLSELEIIESLVDGYFEEKKRSRPRRISNKEPGNQRYITRSAKEKVDFRAGGRCEYVSPTTGKRCDCRTNLVYDHIKPVGMGGESTVSNIRKLCFTHNQRAAIKDFGLEFMEKKIGSRGRPREKRNETGTLF